LDREELRLWCLKAPSWPQPSAATSLRPSGAAPRMPTLRGGAYLSQGRGIGSRERGREVPGWSASQRRGVSLWDLLRGVPSASAPAPAHSAGPPVAAHPRSPGWAGRPDRGGAVVSATRIPLPPPEAGAPGAPLLLVRGRGAAGRGLMEAVHPDTCGEEAAVLGAEGRPAPEARVHFRVTRFIMEAGNRCQGKGSSRADRGRGAAQ
jgi:hypothetical protein